MLNVPSCADGSGFVGDVDVDSNSFLEDVEANGFLADVEANGFLADVDVTYLFSDFLGCFQVVLTVR